MWLPCAPTLAFATGLAAYGITRAPSDNPEAKKIAIQEVWDCPAGRLVLHDKTGKLIEPKFEPSIGLVFDPVLKLDWPDLGARWDPDRSCRRDDL